MPYRVNAATMIYFASTIDMVGLEKQHESAREPLGTIVSALNIGEEELSLSHLVSSRTRWGLSR